MKRLVIFTIFYLVAMHVVAQAPITHTLPVPKKKSTSVNSTLQINYIVKAKDYFKKGNYDQASKMLSNMDKWDSEAYELAGDVCYLWNATLWYIYYEKASEMGSASAKQKLHRNIRSNVISVIGRTINYVYSSRDKYSNTNIHSIADVESLKRDAENGNAEAQFNLGRMYEYGDWVSLDYSKATYWYDKLKENRHVYSTINLAWLFSEGLGVEKDEQKAFNLYMVAANKNMDDAIHNIGLSYEYGKGVRQDKNEAIKWFRKNMDRYLDTYGLDFSTKEYYNLVYAQQIQDGQVLTINACYRLYKYLHNLSGNHDTEIDLIIKRAEVIGTRESEILSEFGRYFVFYRKVKDYNEGLNWLRAAAELNNRRAIRDIGWCYEKGLGVTKNLSRAREYYQKSKELGYNADDDLQRLEKMK